MSKMFFNEVRADSVPIEEKENYKQNKEETSNERKRDYQ